MNDDQRRIKVLWLAKGLGTGGMERLLVSHAHVRDQSKFEVEAAYVRPGSDSLVGELTEAGVPVSCLGGAKEIDPRWVVNLRRLLVRGNFDVVHSHSPMVASAVRIVARTLPRRPSLVYTEHNSWDPYGRPTRLANRLTYSLDDAQLAVSDHARSSVPPHLRGRVRTLVHGIDVAAVAERCGARDAMRRELGVAERPVIGTVANFRVEKAYPNLLDAVTILKDEIPEIRLVCVGSGPLEPEIREAIECRGLHDVVTLTGFRADATSVMSAFDVFVLASDWEGLPVSLMEARALGLPVVATAVGGIPSAVQDREDGYLVPARDPVALAAAVSEVLQVAGVRERLAAASLARSDEFDSVVAVRSIEGVYQDVARR